MKKQIAIALAALACSLAGTAAHAGSRVYWSVGINAAPVSTVISNGPVYAPAPVVYAPPPPVYVEEPVYYEPAPVVYRPVPVVVRQPVYYRPAPVVVYGGGYGGYYRSGHHHHGGWDRDWDGYRDGRDDQTRRHH